MALTEAEIKALQDSKVALEAEKAQLLKELGDKNRLLDEQGRNVVLARKEYKKLSDMTAAEKEALSAKELELQERQEKMEAEAEEFKKQQAEITAKEKQARVDKAIKAIAGTDTAYAEKLKNNLGRIKDYDVAMTEEEISKVVNDGANMLGEARPNPVTTALNSEGGVVEGKNEGAGFAETEGGKDLAKSMNLDIAEPPAPAK
jgi:hypothetical protein